MSNSYILPSTFNRRISVKRAITLADDAGGTSNDGYTIRFETWASVEELNMDRRAYYGLDLFTPAWELILRYTPDRLFTTADLIDYEDRTLSVKSTSTIEQNYKRFTVLLCFESDINYKPADVTPVIPIIVAGVAYGFNANMATSPFNYLQSGFRQLIIDSFGTNITINRYPGGTISNEFNWRTGKKDDGTGHANKLINLKALRDATGEDILFNLNMCSKTLFDQMEMLAEAKATGIFDDTLYVELGNEINNLGSIGHTVFPTAASYAAACTDWIAGIKAVYPYARITACGENKTWQPNWNDIVGAVPGLDALAVHIGPDIPDFVFGGVLDLTALNNVVETKWAEAGMDLVTLPVDATEFNYHFDSGILSNANAKATTLFLIQKMTALVNNNPSVLKLVCVRGLVGNEGAILENSILGPTGLAVQEFLGI